tara:strand:+ start:588 stop:794 length:207 start_codon:yes stop_codon:yes gene_type:complete
MSKKQNWIIEIRALVPNPNAISKSQAMELTKKKLAEGKIDFKLCVWDVEDMQPKKNKNHDHLSAKFKF